MKAVPRAKELGADILVVGGGLGGCAAALAAASRGRRVVLTEETDWIGGQLTSQAVPPDEHPWIEQFGCTRRYRRLREGIRAYYRKHYPLSREALDDPALNPGRGRVSRLCHEPLVALAVLEQEMAYWRAIGRLRVLLRHRPVGAAVQNDRIEAVTFHDILANENVVVSASYVVDATELGDLLPLAKAEYVTGAEPQSETGELHAPADAQPGNVQAFTWCFAVGHDRNCPNDSDRHRIAKPDRYSYWTNYEPSLKPAWCGRLFSWAYCSPVSLQAVERTLFPWESPSPNRALWPYRQIFSREILADPSQGSDVSLINWPQNDFLEGNLIDCPAEQKLQVESEAREFSKCFLYWLQTDAPRGDGGHGYGSLFAQPEMLGTEDGLAKAPYIRESRRIRALFTVTENHVGVEAREQRPPEAFPDSVGIGSYRIDLHPSTGGDNYIDIAAFPFQIPLGALIPVRLTNLLAGGKNLGVTHITNGCYRMHPVEWNVGEAAGLLAAFCLECELEPVQVRQQKREEFQQMLVDEGIELAWPEITMR